MNQEMNINELHIDNTVCYISEVHSSQKAVKMLLQASLLERSHANDIHQRFR